MRQSFIKLTPVWGATFLAVGLGIAACSPAPQVSSASSDAAPTSGSPVAEAAKPRVVVTSSVLCDLTEQVAQNTVNVDCLIEPGTDPHVYEPTPADRRAMEEANLILFSGFNYEPGLIRMVEATNTSIPRIAVFEKAVPQPLMGEPHTHDHGAEKHDHGAEKHDHGAEKAEAHDHGHEAETTASHDHGTEKGLVPDPHIWHNPLHGIEMVEVISDGLAQVSPENASLYASNADAIATQLRAIHGWIETQVATVPNDVRKLVTPHDAFRYFADEFGFTVKGTIKGLSTEERPSPAHLAELIDLVKAAQVPAIFAEQTTNPQLIQSLAREAQVKLAEQPLYVEGPGGPASNAPTYQEMLITNTCTIVDALGGACDRATVPQS